MTLPGLKFPGADFVSGDNLIEPGLRQRLGLGHPDLMQRRFGFRLLRFRQVVRHVRRLVRCMGHRRGIKLQFIQTGEPVHKDFIESFNRKCHVECLNEHPFLSLEQARIEPKPGNLTTPEPAGIARSVPWLPKGTRRAIGSAFPDP